MCQELSARDRVANKRDNLFSFSPKGEAVAFLSCK